MTRCFSGSFFEAFRNSFCFLHVEKLDFKSPIFSDPTSSRVFDDRPSTGFIRCFAKLRRLRAISGRVSTGQNLIGPTASNPPRMPQATKFGRSRQNHQRTPTPKDRPLKIEFLYAKEGKVIRKASKDKCVPKVVFPSPVSPNVLDG